MSRIVHLAAFGLTIMATLWVFSFVLRQPSPLKIWGYAWICLPPLIAAIPFRWPRADLAALGLLLFIVPGLILLTMWYVASAACIVERLGVFASMERSSVLTKGHRWAIFGTWLLLIISGAILAPAVDALAGLTGNAGLITAASLVWSAMTTAFGMVFGGVMYYELRVAKEGIDIHQIAAVFE